MDSPLIIVLPPGVDQRRVLRLIDEEVRRTENAPGPSSSPDRLDEEAPLWTWFLPNPLPPASDEGNGT